MALEDAAQGGQSTGTHLVDATRVPGAHHQLLGQPHGVAVEVDAPVGLRCHRGRVPWAVAGLGWWQGGGPPVLT